MTKVKICGITNIRDARAAVHAGADFLGFVFYAKSPRYVTAGRAGEIVSRLRVELPEADPCLVGVFVDEKLEAVADTLRIAGIGYAQLHGKESPRDVTDLMDQGFGVIKAFRIRDTRSLWELVRYQATAFLLDAYVHGQPGGSGHRFDWDLAVQAKGRTPLLVAGGLTPENVADVIRVVEPWGVDVSSGVEVTPGCKDPGKVRLFVSAAKSGEVGGAQ